MTDAITERLNVLQAEYDAGQQMLKDLDARRTSLATTLLRIEGAIEVLNELSRQLGAVNGASQVPGPHDPGPRLMAQTG